MHLPVGLVCSRSLHEPGVIEGPLDGHVVDAEESRNSFETQLRMGRFLGKAQSQMSDMQWRLKQIEYDRQILSAFFTDRAPRSFKEGTGAECQLGPRSDLARIECLDWLDNEPREESSQDTGELERTVRQAVQHFRQGLSNLMFQRRRFCAF